MKGSDQLHAIFSRLSESDQKDVLGIMWDSISNKAVLRVLRYLKEPITR